MYLLDNVTTDKLFHTSFCKETQICNTGEPLEVFIVWIFTVYGVCPFSGLSVKFHATFYFHCIVCPLLGYSVKSKATPTSLYVNFHKTSYLQYRICPFSGISVKLHATFAPTVLFVHFQGSLKIIGDTYFTLCKLPNNFLPPQ